MSARPDIADLRQRRRALVPDASFIVQAPAGSGKTELLIQRMLVLLARVERPEEIAAMTFTRKAAAEMKQRVLQALAAARAAPRPVEEHEAMTWDLARAVLALNDRLGWNLEASAARLRVQTIDSLCASLTRQMPVLARFGAQPESVDDASGLYLEAARATLALLDGPIAAPFDKGDGERGERAISAADDVAHLLAHLDNNVAIAEGLIASMLARRDHWLRQHGRAGDRDALEAALEGLRHAAVRRARALLAPELDAPAADDAEEWVAFAGTLLTKAGTWRKKHPFYDALAARDDLLAALLVVRDLPPAHYSEEQWAALGAITRLLPLAVAQLKLAFSAHGEADFVEIAQGALAALETDEGPTDLLLSLDYRIRHILVDEFQDTSFTQYELLEKLTAGWEQGDGRTLFVVGDPMQSIYRFREAEVGLFLKARHEGIGGVELEPLTLSANFRSQAGIVDWVNTAFAQVMPGEEDVAAGAVPYSLSQPLHPAGDEAVTVHAFFNGALDAEAARVVALVRAAQAASPEGSVGILVRVKNHLAAITPALRAAGLKFRAIDIEPLAHRPVVQDLLALTRAISHPADRLAWLAVLRAPWCGLTLADLYALAGTDTSSPRVRGEGEVIGHLPVESLPEPISSQSTVWELMHDASHLATLSADGRARLERTRPVLAACMARRLRASLRDQVEGAWLALVGPACAADDTDLEDADIYLDHLETFEEAGAITDSAAFDESLAKLFAQPDLAASERLQIMSIHKAKGLEFDTVIVPGLGSGTGRDERELFKWMELAGEEAGLLLAPINPTGSDKDPIYETIRRLDKTKGAHEAGRLLYVAATRAKRHLHLLGSVKLALKDGATEIGSPAAGSLLEKLWPVVAAEFEQAAALFSNAESAVDTPSPRLRGEGGGEGQLRRLISGWTMPDVPSALAWNAPGETARAQDDIEYSWAGETARHVGSVVHRWLQRIAEDELKDWDEARVASMRESFVNELAARGVEEAQLAAAANRVAKALSNALADPRGRWLLGPQREARNEYRLTAVIAGERRRLVIDRTYADEGGRRWIVDYKTSGHEGTDVEGFLDQERERYRAQLERYAQALARGDGTMLGLYFPLLAGWREWGA
ncbi:MAG: UvrD-helicase domain-containing protein [Proteobacteria bacterium]|nr:UvrD-helicase domain-containing protein [Pseudomonadota bacterium]